MLRESINVFEDPGGVDAMMLFNVSPETRKPYAVLSDAEKHGSAVFLLIQESLRFVSMGGIAVIKR